MVGWTSEAGHISGVIIAVRTAAFDYRGLVSSFAWATVAAMRL